MPVGDLVELGGGLFAPGPLGGPVRGVHQSERGLLGGLGHRVVSEVGGEKGVHARGADGVEEAVAGAAAHRDRTHGRVRVARDADALGGAGQPLGRPFGERAERLGVVELADAAEAPAARGVRRVRHQGPDDAEVERAGEGVGDTGVGGVRVGVRDVQCDVVLDQRVHDPALEMADRHRRGPAHIERVMGDDQLGAEPDRLVGDFLDGVDGEQHASDLRTGVAADRTDRVPLLRTLGRPEDVERGDDFRQTGHANRLPALGAPPSWASGHEPPGLRPGADPGSVVRIGQGRRAGSPHAHWA